MKVCILTTVHQPYDTRIFHKEAKSLAKVHEVVLIAPDDEIADKIVDGVRVITIKKPKSKVLHPVTMWRVFKAGLMQDCDAFHCHEPSSLFVCVILKCLKRGKLIYDAHEHYPSLIAENSLFPGFIRPLIRFLADIEEGVLVKFADFVITVDQILCNEYKEYHKNVHIISNYPKLELFRSSDLNSENEGLIYVGGISRDRGIYQMIDVANKANVKLICVGDFTDELNKSEINKFLAEYPTKNVVFTGHVSHLKVVEYINKSKACLCVLQPIPRYINAVSIKVFEYMACGLPVVASNFPELRKVVKEADCGILVDPTNVDKIADAISYLLEHPEEAKRMGENGRRAVEEKYNWERMEEKLLKLYEGLETCRQS
jgi:glycosyltransferase involved in cell wall biosynthesis